SSIVITNHVNPDGDAMGSALGLFGILKGIGISSRVIVPNQYPDFLKWMEGDDEVVVYEGNEEIAEKYVSEADLIIHLDYNALKRSGPMEECLSRAKAKRIMIDHHQQPDDFADVMFSDTSMSSTCELLFHILHQLGWTGKMQQHQAECLYTGIMTDTGSFRFNSTTPTTHQVAGALLGKGVEPNEMASRVYDINTPGRLQLLSKALLSMEVLPDLPVAIIKLSAEELKRYEYRKGDTEGFVNFGLSVSGVKVSVFMSEKDDLIKMSFRSKGNFDVNKLARKHFNGGGHKNAAGGASHQSLEETVVRFKEIIIDYKDEFQKA
ncbi:MAG: DHH family phosphoesterase, partial [Owenweeksia sp.]